MTGQQAAAVGHSAAAPRIETDGAAITANLAVLRERIGRPVVAVVKANGYGHGALTAARAALDGGAAGLGVVDLAEALALRDAGVTARILTWMHGPDADWGVAAERDIEVGLANTAQIHRIQEAGLTASPLTAHLVVDTGLGREGAHERDWPDLFRAAAEAEAAGAIRCIGLMSHLAGASAADDAAQAEAFQRASALAAEAGLAIRERHLTASAGSLAMPPVGELARVGVAMYGITPFAPNEPVGVNVRGALRLTAPVELDARGAFAPVGEADGLATLRDSGELHHASEHPIVVDSCGHLWRVRSTEALRTRFDPLDVTEPPSRAPARITIIDPDRAEATADSWALASGTIGYEITTRLSARLLPASASPAVPNTGRAGSSPRRIARIDLALAAARLAETRGPVDVTANAYGHGLALLLPLIAKSDAKPLVRRAWDADAVRALGADPIIDPDADDTTRAIYGDAHVRDNQGPLMQLESELIAIKRVDAGQGVSYDYDWIAERPTELGLVPLGYADAIPRRAAGRASLCIRGLRVPIVGRVAMDQVVVDLGDAPGAFQVGDRVVAFAGGSAADPAASSLAEWATWCGTEALVATSTIGPRVHRIAASDAQQPSTPNDSEEPRA